MRAAPIISAAIAAAAAISPPAPAIAQSFSGTGAGATPLVLLLSGTTPVAVEASDDAFSALLLATDGSVVAELSAAPIQTVRIPSDGRYLFDVRTTGTWRISLERADSMTLREVQGRMDGEDAAAAASPAAWLGKGLGAGLLLGPIGTFLIVDRANRSDVSPGPRFDDRLAAADPAYREAFTEAFTDRQRGSRRAAALVGGLTGTAILGFVILQLTVWDESGSSTGGGNGNGGTTTTDTRPPAGFRLVW